MILQSKQQRLHKFKDDKIKYEKRPEGCKDIKI